MDNNLHCFEEKGGLILKGWLIGPVEKKQLHFWECTVAHGSSGEAFYLPVTLHRLRRTWSVLSIYLRGSLNDIASCHSQLGQGCYHTYPVRFALWELEGHIGDPGLVKYCTLKLKSIYPRCLQLFHWSTLKEVKSASQQCLSNMYLIRSSGDHFL